MEDKDELVEWQDAFRLFDKDNDGKISQGELGQLLHSLGHDGSEGNRLIVCFNYANGCFESNGSKPCSRLSKR